MLLRSFGIARWDTLACMARPRNDDVRRLAVLATFDCIASCGVSGLSFREIARLTESSTGTLSHHFGSKQQLLLEAIEYGYWRLPEGFANRPATLTMRYVLSRYELSTPKRRTWWKFWLAMTALAQSDTEIHDAMAREYRSVVERWVNSLTRGQHAGLFRADFVPAVEANRLAAFAHGLAIAQLTDPMLTADSAAALHDALFRLCTEDGLATLSS